MLEIEKAFNTTGQSIYDFYQKPGMGLYIPLYQREYSWDTDNVNQLLEDISRGIERLIETEDDSEIRFLGTIITVTEKDPNKIEPIDWTALPTAIFKVIDGQQRLSTICLFACQLYKHIDILEKKLTAFEDLRDDVLESCENWKDKLLDVFSLDLKLGKPKRKPKIIRGNDDKWIKAGPVDEAYSSSLANYIAKFINHVELDEEIPIFDKKTNVGKNALRINKWLENDVTLAHVNNDETFIPAWDILEKLDEKYIWNYSRPEFKQLVLSKNISNKKSPEFLLCSLVQTFSVCHYLLQRCCFTLIQPANDDWAFDMFQSLNASGTPLTAIETFKPLVVNTVTKSDPNKTFKGSQASKSFDKIEKLFSSANSAAQKSKLTNDFLTSFAITINADKLTSHFSHQRKWLDKRYNDLSVDQREEYVDYMGAYADFYRKWEDYKGLDNELFEPIRSNPEADIASMLILYLKESGHKMAVTVLAFLYSDISKGKDDSIQKFIEGVKSVAAFYTIWRSSISNSGLDNVYRQFFKGDRELGPNNWLTKKSLDVNALKHHFKNALDEKGIVEKDKWIGKANGYLSYKSRSITKLILINSFHDTIVDDKNNGLMKTGNTGVVKYLTLEKWNSSGCKTIEHIAPQSNDSSVWDSNLHQEPEELFQKIGNLTLLPVEINSSIGNKGWKEKLLYYKHLSEQDPDKLTQLANKAKDSGIDLKTETIDLLKKAEYNDHIKSIVTVGEDGNWDADLVRSRTKRILDIAWNRLYNWL